ncbi:hypothetical protein R3P38DRAFT_2937088 [Favolaschia claudopus]|uniref:F-box domain-containing protein n=1 Tax=Favolaschia claudopus TaxID=2862362 RepID=A0AAW0BQW5_9AGAR
MPPRRKKSKKIQSDDEDEEVSPQMQSGPVFNVPIEIWEQIVSASNFLILGSEKDGIPRSLLLLGRSRITSCPKVINAPLYWEHPTTLRALSQTCRAFRAIFLPLLWERVEACFQPKNSLSSQWNKRVAMALLHKCKGLLKPQNQSLASYPRINSPLNVMSVSFSGHRIKEVAPLFAKCLASLPNLDTLHILHLQSKYGELLDDVFEDVEMKRLRTIIIPSSAYGVLASAPNVRDVSCNEGKADVLLDTILEFCPNVERLQGFEITTLKQKRLKEVAAGLPKLREIVVPSHSKIDALAVFKHLTLIELIGYPSLRKKESEEKQRYIEAASKILRASDAAKKTKRVVRVSYWPEITGMLGMMTITYGRYWEGAEDFEVEVV